MVTKKGKIVLVGGQKGGTGKTTIAINLAVLRAKAGRDVVLIDTDPQGNANGWVLTRDEAGITPRIACLLKFGKGLGRELKDLTSRYQDIIVDAGGHDSIELRAAMTQAEIFISPIKPSQFDLWTLKNLDELIQSARGFNPDMKAMIVISLSSTHPNDQKASSAAELISIYKNSFSLAKAEIHQRNIYMYSAGMGQGVVEYSKPIDKATQEIKQLCKEIYGNE